MPTSVQRQYVLNTVCDVHFIWLEPRTFFWIEIFNIIWKMQKKIGPTSTRKLQNVPLATKTPSGGQIFSMLVINSTHSVNLSQLHAYLTWCLRRWTCVIQYQSKAESIQLLVCGSWDWRWGNATSYLVQWEFGPLVILQERSYKWW